MPLRYLNSIRTSVKLCNSQNEDNWFCHPMCELSLLKSNFFFKFWIADFLRFAGTNFRELGFQNKFSHISFRQVPVRYFTSLTLRWLLDFYNYMNSNSSTFPLRMVSHLQTEQFPSQGHPLFVSSPRVIKFNAKISRHTVRNLVSVCD